jgi:hypothetical protein
MRARAARLAAKKEKTMHTLMHLHIRRRGSAVVLALLLVTVGAALAATIAAAAPSPSAAVALEADLATRGGGALTASTLSDEAARPLSVTEYAPVPAGIALQCPAGTGRYLRVATFPEATTKGAATPELALRVLDPQLTDATFAPMSRVKGGPVWIAIASRTFIASSLPDGTWFVSPATFVGCLPPPPAVPQGPARPDGTRG